MWLSSPSARVTSLGLLEVVTIFVTAGLGIVMGIFSETDMAWRSCNYYLQEWIRKMTECKNGRGVVNLTGVRPHGRSQASQHVDHEGTGRDGNEGMEGL
jgi:hypothetical protein